MDQRIKSRTTLLACLVAGLTCCLGAPAASASVDQEMILQDDPEIVFPASTGELDRTLARVRALGVDRIRVSVFWHLVAPAPRSRREPDFGPHGPRWPGSYPEYGWRRYDDIARLASKHGLGVLMSITGPAPVWATSSRRRKENNLRPSAPALRDFAAAVGFRYSGFWPDPDRREAAGKPPVPIPGEEPESDPQSYLPRLDHWSIWNEPNFPSWLMPQWERVGRRYRPVAPHIYRGLVDAAFAGLQESGHGTDVILLGETAPYGPRSPRRPGAGGLISPVRFVRELYCVDDSYEPLRGRAARARGCPGTDAERERFLGDHPALFTMAGWAHHGYSLKKPPTFLGRRRDAAPLGAVNRLLAALDEAQFAWGGQGDKPVWLTEYGYQTPPDPFFAVPFPRQARWLSWAEFLSYRNPRVASFAQFLLVDDLPRLQYRARDKRRWVTWQSGLVAENGAEKPAYEEFQRPIHVTPARARRGRSVRVFGAYRPALDGAPLTARVEFHPAGGGWQPLAELTVANRRGYLDTRVRPPGSGFVRIVWRDPAGGAQLSSRAARVVLR